MDSPAPRAYRSGNFRVDLRRQQLSGPDGANLNLSARAYDVLVFLLEHRDRVVSKNELMKAVWPRSVVEENNLNQAITILRRALGDRRDSPQFVRTVAGRGYRFVGEVVEEPATRGSDEPAGQSPLAESRLEFDAVGAQKAALPVPPHEQPLPRTVTTPVDGGPYSLAAESTDLYGYLGAPTQSAADRLDFAVTLHPSAAPSGDMDLTVMSGADSLDGI